MRKLALFLIVFTASLETFAALQLDVTEGLVFAQESVLTVTQLDHYQIDTKKNEVLFAGLAKNDAGEVRAFSFRIESASFHAISAYELQQIMFSGVKNEVFARIGIHAFSSTPTSTASIEYILFD